MRIDRKGQPRMELSEVEAEGAVDFDDAGRFVEGIKRSSEIEWEEVDEDEVDVVAKPREETVGSRPLTPWSYNSTDRYRLWADEAIAWANAAGAVLTRLGGGEEELDPGETHQAEVMAKIGQVYATLALAERTDRKITKT